MLAVAPINLIPSCKDCNYSKLADAPTCSEEAIIHPYYDDISNDEWVLAMLDSKAPLSYRFEINLPINCDQELGNRLIKHFSLLKLDELYASNASNELASIDQVNRNLFNEGGESLLKSHLNDSWSSFYQWNKNAWKTALFRALLNCEFYCKEHFTS